MKRSSVVAALAAMTLVTTTAWAGAKSGYVVQVDTVNRTASGTMATVRATADSTQYLDCNIQTASGTGLTIYCQARDANGVTGACSSSAQNFVQIVGLIHGDSHVSFSWSATGACTALSVDNGSFFAPKQP